MLLNKGDGAFEDASAAFGLPDDRASLGAAAADFDADRRIDLFLTGVGGNRLLRNKDGKCFEDLTELARRIPAPRRFRSTARWLDLDQDGDLDLYVVNYTAAEHADEAFLADGRPRRDWRTRSTATTASPRPIRGSPAPAWAPLAVAWENVKAIQGLSIALVPWTDMEPLREARRAHTGIAACDVDGDRDLDLILTADGDASVASSTTGWACSTRSRCEDDLPLETVSGLLDADFDPDGRPDLVAPSPSGRLQIWRNTTEHATATRARSSPSRSSPTNADDWRSATAVDLDLDGRVDLVGPHAAERDVRTPMGAQRATRLAAEHASAPAPTPTTAGRRSALPLVDLAGDALPDSADRSAPASRRVWPETWATATTGWRSSSAAAGRSSPS